MAAVCREHDRAQCKETKQCRETIEGKKESSDGNDDDEDDQCFLSVLFLPLPPPAYSHPSTPLHVHFPPFLNTINTIHDRPSYSAAEAETRTLVRSASVCRFFSTTTSLNTVVPTLVALCAC